MRPSPKSHDLNENLMGTSSNQNRGKCIKIALITLVVVAVAVGAVVGVLAYKAGGVGNIGETSGNQAGKNDPTPNPNQSYTANLTTGMSWQYQLKGTVDTSIVADLYDIDMFDTPQATIDALKANGKVVICYFSAGSSENWRIDYGNFSGLEGSPLDGWPGEKWLNVAEIKQTNSKLKAAISWRMDLAKAKKCDGVEADNVDGYNNDNGLGLTADDQIAYNSWLADEAHARGMRIGLKNDVDQVLDLVSKFDFSVVEQCYQYTECDSYLPMIEADKPVFIVEYQATSTVQTHCTDAASKSFTLIAKDLELEATPYWKCP